MYTVELNEINVEEYAQYLGWEIAENIGRAFFRGLVLREDDVDRVFGWLIWELKNMESKEKVKSIIHWFEADDSEQTEILFSRYKELIAADNVEESTILIPATRERQRMRQILKKQGFDMMLMEGDCVAVKLGEILKMPIFEKSQTRSRFVYPLDDMSLRSYRRVITKLSMLGQKGACEDLAFLPKGYFEKNISCFYEENEEVRGVLLFHKTPGGSLELKVMRALSNNNKVTSQIILSLMMNAIETMKENCSEQTEVVVDRHNHSAFLLSEKLFPRGFGKPVYGGSRKEV